MSAAAQYLALSRRSVFNTFRQPTAIVPALMFPLIFLTLTASALARAIDLPGFPPVDSFFQFAISTTIVQGALFGSIAAGSDMATDIQGGFFDRLVASPVARTSILVGRLAGASALGLFQTLVYFGITMAFGMSVRGGIGGVLLVASISMIVAAGIGALAVAFGLRTGSSEAVQGAFPLLFVMLFFSSAFFPRNLMEGWFQTVATYNPLSRLIEGVRQQIIVGVDWGHYLTALGVAVGILVLGVSVALLALRARLAAGE